MAMDSASDVIEDALKFPMSDDDWVVTVFIGGILFAVYYFFSFVTAFLPILIIITFVFIFGPMLLIGGFQVQVIREALHGEDLPEWSDAGIGGLLGDGVKLAVIGFVYSLVIIGPVVLLFATVAFLGGAAGEEAGSTLAGIGSAISVLLYIVGALLLSYLLPAATVNFARSGSIGDGFAIGTITDVVTSRDYVVGWLLAVAVSILMSIVGSIVSITIIGILLVPWVYFFFSISLAYVYAHAYAGGLGLEIPAEDVVEVGG